MVISKLVKISSNLIFACWLRQKSRKRATFSLKSHPIYPQTFEIRGKAIRKKCAQHSGGSLFLCHFGLNFDRFWLARLGFHLSEPPKSQFHISGDEKHKVEHLSFLKHKKLSPNSCWAPRSMSFARNFFFRFKKKNILDERDLAL